MAPLAREIWIRYLVARLLLPCRGIEKLRLRHVSVCIAASLHLPILFVSVTPNLYAARHGCGTSCRLENVMHSVGVLLGPFRPLRAQMSSLRVLLLCPGLYLLALHPAA